MNIFKRLFRIGEAEANSVVDKMEDPIKLTEQGIRDLKSDLTKSLEALAQVKASSIMSRNDEKKHLNQAGIFEEKAIAILKNKDLNDAEKDKLAQQALIKKGELEKMASLANEEHERTSKAVLEIETNISKLRSNISKWESELRTLKSRVKVSKAQTSLNKQMAEMDSNGTVDMLKRMQQKVEEEEAKAEAYGDIANNTNSVEDEIDKAADLTSSKAESELEALKKKIANNS